MLIASSRAAWAQQPALAAPIDPNSPYESPSNPTPTEAKPADAKPADAKPTDAKPADDLKDIEAALASDAAAAKAAAPAPSGGGATSALTSLNPDLAFILDVAGAWFSKREPLQSGGHDPTANGFTLQQLELSIGKAVDPYFRFDGNIVFLRDGVEVEEAYATTLALPHSLQVRAGQFLTRFGRLNSTHLHAWDFVDQPFAIGRVFGGDGNRGLGVELSYLTPAPFFLELVGSVTTADGEGTARSFLGASEDPPRSPLDVQATIAVKEFFELSHDWSLATGQSFATGPNATGEDNRTDVYGADLFLKYRPITQGSYTMVALQTEWILRRRQVPGALLADVSGYAYAAWRFARRWTTAARYEYGSAPRDTDGHVMADDLDPDWMRSRHRASVALTFSPTEFSRLRAQGGVDAPRWLDDPIWSAFLAMEVSIGAHGAHKF